MVRETQESGVVSIQLAGTRNELRETRGEGVAMGGVVAIVTRDFTTESTEITEGIAGAKWAVGSIQSAEISDERRVARDERIAK